MRNWIVDIYDFWAKHRSLLTILVVTGLGWAVWFTAGLTLDKSLKAFLPDSSAQLRRSVELMDIAPFTKWTLIQLTAEEPGAIPKLPQVADDLVAGLNPELLKPLGSSDDSQSPALDPPSFMALLPALCDQVCLANIGRNMVPEQVDLALSRLKTSLAGPGGLDSLFWRTDPLGLRKDIFSHFPAYQGQPLVNPLIGYPVTPDGRRLLIVVKPQISMNDTSGSQALAANIQDLVKKLPAGVSAQIAGAHLHTAANAGAIESDLVLTMSLALVLILAIYLLLVRSLGAAWIFVTPILAMVAAVVGLKLVFPTVSGLALGFGAAVLGIAGDYAVHVYFAFRYASSKQEALKHVARPLMISTVLCGAGFGVLLFSSIPALRQLAFFSAVSIGAGLIWAIIILPHCPGMGSAKNNHQLSSQPQRQFQTDQPQRQSQSQPQRQFQTDQPQGGLLSGKIWMVFVALGGLTATLGYYMPFDSSIKALGFSSATLMEDSRVIEETWKLDGGHIVLLAEGRNPDEALALAGRLVTAWGAGKSDGVKSGAGQSASDKSGTASSLAGLVPGLEVQRANLNGWRKMMAASRDHFEGVMNEAALEHGFAPEAFAPFLKWFLADPDQITLDSLARAGLGLLPDNFMAEKNGRYYALVLLNPEASSQLDSFDYGELPVDRIFELSSFRLEQALSGALGSEKSLLPWCIVICLAILVWFYKSLNLAMLAFIPALGGLAAVFGTQLVLGKPLGLAEMAALPLVICLGADYGIVVVSELLENSDFGASRAILVSGLSTISGIGILALASHPVLQSLGQTVFAGLVVAMVASIFLLPKIYGSGRPVANRAF